MSPVTHVTRFAPSPSGSLHLGNARTALYNQLAARAGGGRLVLRIEDTDAERSDERHLAALLADLQWLGLRWDEGPDVGGPHAPYRQSERVGRHSAAIGELRAAGRAYPCFCTPETLAISRKSQLAAGRPPRYAGTCAALDPAVAARRIAAGESHAMRFRVEPGRVVEFEDLVHGPQRFLSDDIGDFVIARADGTAAFFLGNAVDDADMGVTLVLRGDDHLANTPRQLLILEALGRRAPRYGHLPLLLGPSGAPLSKRDGAAGLGDLRTQGWLPGAIRNYLVRLGHGCGGDEWLDDAAMAARFDLAHVSRSAARYDETQLRHWQREAVTRASVDELVDWLGARLAPLGEADRRAAFVEAVRGNLLLPDDALPLVGVVCDDVLQAGDEAGAAIREAGAAFYAAALDAWRRSGGDFRAFAAGTGSATGRKGAALYRPLRAALTGITHGPELAPLIALMGERRVERRLAEAGTR